MDGGAERRGAAAAGIAPVVLGVLVSVAAILAAASGPPASDAAAPPVPAVTEEPSAGATAGARAGEDRTTSAAMVAPMVGPARPAALLVAGRERLDARVRRLVDRAPSVTATAGVAVASVPVRGRMVTLLAADPSTYRRFAPAVTARADAVWARVAEGELLLSSELADDLGQGLGNDLRLGSGEAGLPIRVGATGPLPALVGGVVDASWVARLGMVADNGLVVAVRGDAAAAAVSLRRRLGDDVTVSSLVSAASGPGRRTAFLTGGGLAAALGAFEYHYRPDGTVEPDPAWVAANIRTEPVPILGAVTCHRLMLPQLRAALMEVVEAGLAPSVDPGDYGGCYAPRFIGHDPGKGLSLHTWGIAVDLNVHENLRGSVGRIDPRVVAIFRRWGFAWGGDWAYTDPMHFELAAFVPTG